MKILTKQSYSCPYFVNSYQQEIKGGPYFPIIIVQNDYSGPNS